MHRQNPFLPDRRRYTAPKRGGCVPLLAAIGGAAIGALAALTAVGESDAPHFQRPAPSPTHKVEFRETYPPLPVPDQPAPGLLI